jgi:hypothetical protein
LFCLKITLKYLIQHIQSDENLSSNHKTKKFYFQEIDKIIEFPNVENSGKYSEYIIKVKNRDTSNEAGKPTTLGEFLESTTVDNNYPHTVGYYKQSIGEGPSFMPEYLELRKICRIEELWFFLNASNL